MEQLKAMIFEYINKNSITDDELKKLYFALAKETAKTKNINRLCLLYLNNMQNFYSTLEDILQQATLNYFEYLDINIAYKETQKYVYNQHTKRQDNHTDVENVEHLLLTEIDAEHVQETFASYTIKLDSKDKAEYYKSLILRTEKNLKSKQQRVFTSSRQKQQTLNKLQKMQII